MPSESTVEEVTPQSHEYELVPADEQQEQDLSKWLLACAEMVETAATADWPIENV